MRPDGRVGGAVSAFSPCQRNRLVRFNVLAMSGHAVEAAGDVDTLLLHKTGSITLGNQQGAGPDFGVACLRPAE